MTKEFLNFLLNFLAPALVTTAMCAACWLMVGFLYLNLGFDAVSPTPYGDMMRGIFEGRAGVRAARTHNEPAPEVDIIGFLGTDGADQNFY